MTINGHDLSPDARNADRLMRREVAIQRVANDAYAVLVRINATFPKVAPFTGAEVRRIIRAVESA